MHLNLHATENASAAGALHAFQNLQSHSSFLNWTGVAVASKVDGIGLTFYPTDMHGKLMAGLRLAPDPATGAMRVGSCKVFLLHGMFGLGKTTMARDVLAAAQQAGRMVVWAHCGQALSGDQLWARLVPQPGFTASFRGGFPAEVRA